MSVSVEAEKYLTESNSYLWNLKKKKAQSKLGIEGNFPKFIKKT